MLSSLFVVFLAIGLLSGPFVWERARDLLFDSTEGSIQNFRENLSKLYERSQNSLVFQEKIPANGQPELVSYNLRVMEARKKVSKNSVKKREIIKKRRLVALLFAEAFFLSFVLGFIPELTAMWIISAISLAGLAAYLWAVSYVNNIQREKTVKLTYLRSSNLQSPKTFSVIGKQSTI